MRARCKPLPRRAVRRPERKGYAGDDDIECWMAGCDPPETKNNAECQNAS